MAEPAGPSTPLSTKDNVIRRAREARAAIDAHSTRSKSDIPSFTSTADSSLESSNNTTVSSNNSTTAFHYQFFEKKRALNRLPRRVFMPRANAFVPLEFPSPILSSGKCSAQDRNFAPLSLSSPAASSSRTRLPNRNLLRISSPKQTTPKSILTPNFRIPSPTETSLSGLQITANPLDLVSPRSSGLANTIVRTAQFPLRSPPPSVVAQDDSYQLPVSEVLQLSSSSNSRQSEMEDGKLSPEIPFVPPIARKSGSRVSGPIPRGYGNDSSAMDIDSESNGVDLASASHTDSSVPHSRISSTKNLENSRTSYASPANALSARKRSSATLVVSPLMNEFRINRASPQRILSDVPTNSSSKKNSRRTSTKPLAVEMPPSPNLVPRSCRPSSGHQDWPKPSPSCQGNATPTLSQDHVNSVQSPKMDSRFSNASTVGNSKRLSGSQPNMSSDFSVDFSLTGRSPKRISESRATPRVSNAAENVLYNKIPAQRPASVDNRQVSPSSPHRLQSAEGTRNTGRDQTGSTGGIQSDWKKSRSRSEAFTPSPVQRHAKKQLITPDTPLFTTTDSILSPQRSHPLNGKFDARLSASASRDSSVEQAPRFPVELHPLNKCWSPFKKVDGTSITPHTGSSSRGVSELSRHFPTTPRENIISHFSFDNANLTPKVGNKTSSGKKMHDSASRRSSNFTLNFPATPRIIQKSPAHERASGFGHRNSRSGENTNTTSVVSPGSPFRRDCSGLTLSVPVPSPGIFQKSTINRPLNGTSSSPRQLRRSGISNRTFTQGTQTSRTKTSSVVDKQTGHDHSFSPDINENADGMELIEAESEPEVDYPSEKIEDNGDITALIENDDRLTDDESELKKATGLEIGTQKLTSVKRTLPRLTMYEPSHVSPMNILASGIKRQSASRVSGYDGNGSPHNEDEMELSANSGDFSDDDNSQSGGLQIDQGQASVLWTQQTVVKKCAIKDVSNRNNHLSSADQPTAKQFSQSNRSPANDVDEHGTPSDLQLSRESNESVLIDHENLPKSYLDKLHPQPDWASYRVMAPTPEERIENDVILISAEKSDPSTVYWLCAEHKLMQDPKCPFEYYVLLLRLFPFQDLVNRLIPYGPAPTDDDLNRSYEYGYST